MSQFDAIIVPGGGVRDGGSLPVWVERRLDRAVERQGSAFIMTLSAGTPYRPPPLDARGFPIFESIAAANYLLARGVAPDRILVETASYDTIGNAYFSRLIHAEPRQFRKLLVITSEFHLERTEAAFRWIYALSPSPGYQLTFESTSDDCIPAPALAARRTKERAALQELREIAARLGTLSELHHWMFTRHGAYRVGTAEPQLSDQALLPTY